MRCYNDDMAKSTLPVGKKEKPRWRRGTDVSMRMIRRFARQVAERFEPEKIILFGSHAYGTPHDDSDVDILVIMPATNQLSQATRIRLAVPREFALDLLVRTPEDLKWRLEEGDFFLREIVSKGKVLYAKAHPRVGPKGRSRLQINTALALSRLK